MVWLVRCDVCVAGYMQKSLITHRDAGTTPGGLKSNMAAAGSTRKGAG